TGVGDCNPGADWGTLNGTYASDVVRLVNQHRQGKGLVTLQVSPTLTNAAAWKALHMAKYAYMSHDDPAPPIARTAWERIQACGYPSNAGWGENIAYGYRTPPDVVNAWLNSSGHRANIENASFRAIGVGAAASSGGTMYWAQEFGTYVDSGSTSSPPPSAPTVTLTSAPASSTTSTSASFGWTTSGTVTSTTCSLDGRSPVSCSSPRSYSSLSTGTHSFRVTVSNSAGSSSASYSWTITSSTSTSAPTVKITSGPSGWTSLRSATFSWTTTGTVSSTKCSLDGAAPVACASPRSYSGLATGRHTFTVTVSNSAGSASAIYSWYIF
ncbi:MAG: CAP domain-containing protein, partial [Actinomycetota bacterium]|nr:CAP domain-containing protein [Actinomycetota bacterium]